VVCVTDRRLAIHAANPACVLCGGLVRSIKESMVQGEEVQRLAHLKCFVRDILKVNTTFNSQLARQRAEATRERLVS
jgi:hypothetical protein